MVAGRFSRVVAVGGHIPRHFDALGFLLHSAPRDFPATATRHNDSGGDGGNMTGDEKDICQTNWKCDDDP